jgi:hypothetical protein
MTMQVGLVGTDGIVLASDQNTLFTYSRSERGEFEEVLVDDLTSKILVGQRNAIAFSGWDISGEVARRILADETILDSDDPRNDLETLARKVYGEPFPGKNDPIRHDSELLIVSTGNMNKFYSLDMKSEKYAFLTQREKAVAGHKVNSASFFLQRYYVKTKISELAFLAAHVILAASSISYGGIKGLEIVTCTKSGFRLLPPDVIANLAERSEKLDRQIGETLRK